MSERLLAPHSYFGKVPMTDQTIPEEAVEAAAWVLAGADRHADISTAWIDCARRVLAAAYPHLRQQTETEHAPLESYTITTECRANRGDGGAWDEAVARLRVVYNAQLARFGPAAVYRIDSMRGLRRDL